MAFLYRNSSGRVLTTGQRSAGAVQMVVRRSDGLLYFHSLSPMTDNPDWPATLVNNEYQSTPPNRVTWTNVHTTYLTSNSLGWVEKETSGSYTNYLRIATQSDGETSVHVVRINLSDVLRQSFNNVAKRIYYFNAAHVGIGNFLIDEIWFGTNTNEYEGQIPKNDGNNWNYLTNGYTVSSSITDKLWVSLLIRVNVAPTSSIYTWINRIDFLDNSDHLIYRAEFYDLDYYRINYYNYKIF